MATDKTMEKLSGVDVWKKRKGLLISPELCMGCRGCQTACKSWNKLPADKTHNAGSYENPADLTHSLYNRIRFVEIPKEGMEWLFVSQRCMHCADAGCMTVCPAPGALYRTKEGAVGFNAEKCIGCRMCLAGCPFNIPRYDANNRVSKCNLCEDRIANGLTPACAKTCPTGAIKYGTRDDLIAGAKKAGYERVYGEADLAGLGVVYAFKKNPEHYGYNAAPGIPVSVVFWREVLKPLTIIGLGAAIAATGLHYISVGPKEDGEEGGDRS